jgi:hypothetical protein
VNSTMNSLVSQNATNLLIFGVRILGGIVCDIIVCIYRENLTLKNFVMFLKIVYYLSQ